MWDLPATDTDAVDACESVKKSGFGGGGCAKAAEMKAMEGAGYGKDNEPGGVC